MKECHENNFQKHIQKQYFSKLKQFDDDEDFVRLEDPPEEEQEVDEDGVPTMEVDHTPFVVEASSLAIGGNVVDDSMVAAAEASEKKVQKRVEKQLSNVIGQVLEDVRFAMSMKVCFFARLLIFIFNFFQIIFVNLSFDCLVL